MKIGFDSKRLFCNFTGLGNYSRTLLKNLTKYYSDNEYHLYTPKITNNTDTAPFINDINYRTYQSGSINKSLWRSYSIVKQLQKDKIELYHGLSNELPFNINKSDIKSIVSIHDLIFKVYPETYPYFDRKMYDLKFRNSCKNADKIIAISESTKNDIIKLYKIEPDKIEVIYQACNPIYYEIDESKDAKPILQQYGIPNEYLLYVGSIERRKNLKTIINSYEHLPEDLRIPLVVIGKGNEYMIETKDLIKTKGLEKLIIWTNYFENNNHLKTLYQNAKAFIYPSLYEGFGLPVVEWLLSKTPVITSNTSSLPEAGGPDSLYINPNNAEELALAITKILIDEKFRNTMIEKGYQYAINKFSPAKLSEQMINLYHNTLYNT